LSELSLMEKIYGVLDMAIAFYCFMNNEEKVKLYRGIKQNVNYLSVNYVMNSIDKVNKEMVKVMTKMEMEKTEKVMLT